MNEKPILFSAPMVRALLGGRKSQTRRVIKPQPLSMDAPWPTAQSHVTWGEFLDEPDYFAGCFCPYGQPGDRLWVRETWQAEHGGAWWWELETDHPEALNWNMYYRATEEDLPAGFPGWRPSIFMPRWASRVMLEITGVRAERVQEMGENNAIVEGVIPDPHEHYLSAYVRLWDQINAKRGYPWESNPWVWVISFAVLQPGTYA